MFSDHTMFKNNRLKMVAFQHEQLHFSVPKARKEARKESKKSKKREEFEFSFFILAGPFMITYFVPNVLVGSAGAHSEYSLIPPYNIPPIDLYPNELTTMEIRSEQHYKKFLKRIVTR